MPQEFKNKIWTYSETGIRLTQAFESCSLRAYQGIEDRKGLITIGWGSIMRKDGSRFRLGDTITQSQADDLLRWETGMKATAVNSMVKGCMITQSMFDALVDFAYNKGISNLEGSSLIKKIRVNPMDPTIFEFKTDPKTGYGVPGSCSFLGWTLANGKRQPGLVRRGTSQAYLYRTGILCFFD